jgi:hypothetical protein
MEKAGTVRNLEKSVLDQYKFLRDLASPNKQLKL